MFEAIKAAIGKRVFGPFNAKGIPGDSERGRLDTATRYYLYCRKRRKVKPQEAMRLACLIALRPYSRTTPQYYASAAGNVGQRWQPDGDSTVYRWAENTDKIGLRFLGYCDEIAPRSVNHLGWFNRADIEDSTLRGCVFLLPGKRGKSRFIPAYRELEGRGEVNPGSACLAVSEMVSEDMRDSAYCFEGAEQAAIESGAVALADSIAEHRAESERDYDSAYQAGREAGESMEQAETLRGEALELLSEMRAIRKSPHTPLSPVGRICDTLRARVESILESIQEAREARESSYSDNRWQSEAWRAGYMDSQGLEAWNRAAKALGA